MALPDDDLTRTLLITDVNAQGVSWLTLVGGTYTILVSGEQTGGAYTLIDMVVPPGGGPPLHRHDFEELFIVLDGSLDFTFRGSTTTVHAGRVVNIPANAPHHFSNTSDQPVHMLCMCTPAGQDDFFLEVGQRVDADGNLLDAATMLTDAERFAQVAAAARYRAEML